MRKMLSATVLGVLFGSALLFACLAAPSPALANVFAAGDEMGNPGPLQQQGDIIEIAGDPLRILVFPNGSLQVFHENYAHGATFGEAGSGFFLAVGEAVYGPRGTPFTLLRQEGPFGSGTSGSPFQVVTEGQIRGDGYLLQIVQTVSYVNGDNYFQLQWAITNTGNEFFCFKAYHAADLYFADDDYGLGYYDSQSGAVGGFNQANDWFMVFIPSMPTTHYEEAHYATIWERVNSAADLQDTIDPAYIDNGAALQWEACLQGRQVASIGDQWSFGVSEAAAINPGENIEPGQDIEPGQIGGASEGFRQPGPLTPEITTYVPTPLDISTDPLVIGTNLFLAALAMILFTIASEILNRTLAKNEGFMQRFLKPLRWVQDLTDRLSLGKRLGRPLWFELLKLVLIMLIYGFVFSLLDRSWQPFSLTGIYLFVTMTLAYGIVGLADDIAQWAAARRWKLASSLSVRPGNLLTAVASTAFSRIFGILPGIMFGMPEAFDIDEAALENRRTENALLRIAAGVLFMILLTAWLPTALTALVLRGGGPEFLLVLIGGLQSFLLLIFAVTVQNIFLHMLAMPNTFGRALARWNKPVWAMGFLAATFLFLHTLLNPHGELVNALTSTNVLVFVITVFLFLVFTVSVWLFFQIVGAFTKKPASASPQSLEAPESLAVIPRAKSSKVWLWCLLIVVVLCLCLIGGAVVVVLALEGIIPAEWLMDLLIRL